MRILSVIAAASVLAFAAPALAQAPRPDVQAAQAQGMARLNFMHGVWVGPASGFNPDRTPFSVTQTERIGPMLDGQILVIEGRGYERDGSTGFNAFAVVSYEPQSDRYVMRSYAQGYVGDFVLNLTDNGYTWEVPAGPGVMRYTAEVSATTYHEVGEFVMDGQPPRRAFEMTLTRRGDTDWPAGGAVDPAP